MVNSRLAFTYLVHEHGQSLANCDGLLHFLKVLYSSLACSQHRVCFIATAVNAFYTYNWLCHYFSSMFGKSDILSLPSSISNP